MEQKSTMAIYKRKILRCILFSILTLGLYQIVWAYLLLQNTRAIKKDRSKYVGELLCLVFLPLYPMYWYFTRGTVVKKEFAKRNYPVKGNPVLYLVFSAFGLYLVPMAIMQSDFNSLPLVHPKEAKQHKGLPFHVVKRVNIPIWKKILIYAIALLSSLLLSSLICSVFSGKDSLQFFQSLFKGAFGTERRIWLLLLEAALLLGTSMALIPAFKMKFWNLGGNGQILMGCFAAYTCSYWLGGKIPDVALILLMLVTGVAAGIIWALIPALFKAFFNTNETLFTLMMNYIAAGIVLYCRASWIKSGSAQFPTLKYGILPKIYNNMLPTILIFVLLTLFMFVYLKYSKHGYEISVVGESVNTAKYIGINVRKVIIRTMILSGAIAGLVGFLLIARTGPGLSNDTPNNMGFTAIMTSWLAAFNPLLMLLTCFFISFISKGMTQVRTDFHLTNNSIANIVIGLIYFFVIACAFFVNYKIVFRKKEDK